MTIWDMGRVGDNLFQIIKNRKCKSFNSPNIRVGRFQPLPVVYIEVSEIEKFCLRVFGCHGLMARVKIVKESYKVCRIGRGVSETEKDSDGQETNLKPDDIKVWRLEVHKAYSRRVDVGVDKDSSSDAES